MQCGETTLERTFIWLTHSRRATYRARADAGANTASRMSAHYLLAEGTGEAHIWQSLADLRSILSVENPAGALVSSAKRAFAKTSPVKPLAWVFVGSELAHAVGEPALDE